MKSSDGPTDQLIRDGQPVRVMYKNLIHVVLIVALTLVPCLLVRATAPPVIILRWNYPYPSGYIVFNIYHTTNLAPGQLTWSLIGTTNGTNFAVARSTKPGAHFFTVAASNTVTGLQTFVR